MVGTFNWWASKHNTAGGADYLVTGDKLYLLLIEEYRGVWIVSPAVFLVALQIEL